MDAKWNEKDIVKQADEQNEKAYWFSF